MPFDIGIGGGNVARVNEPSRGQFPTTLGGAVEYTVSHWVYRVLEIMGGGMGAFLAGLGVQFLDRIEPALVEYTAPLIDRILGLPDLDPDVRAFLVKVRTPKDAAGAAVLAGIGSQAGGSVIGSVLGVLQIKLAQGLMAVIRPSIPDISASIAMRRWGLISEAELTALFAKHGYPDGYGSALVNIAQMRASVADLIESYFRGLLTASALLERLTKLGVAPEDASLLIQNSYRLMDAGTLLPAMYRGLLTRTEVVAEFRKSGIPDRVIELILGTTRPIPAPPDLVRFGVREAYRDDIAAQWAYDEDFPAEFARDMALHGFDPIWAKRYWRAHWDLPSLSMGYEMLHRGIISKTELTTLLKIQDIPAFWRDRLVRAAYSPLTRVDVRRMYGVDVLTREGVKRSYLDLGYDETNAERLAEFTVRYESAKGESKPEEYKELTLGLIQQAYLKSIISAEEFRTRVGELPYPAEEVDLLLKITDARKVIEKTPDYTVEYRRDVKAIVERAYYKGTLSENTARDYLTLAGLSEEEIGYSLAANDLARIEAVREAELKIVGDAYQARALTRVEAVERLGQLDIPAREQERLFTDWAIPRDLGTRRLTEAQYRLALTREIIDPDYYEESLRGLGYSDVDVAILVKLATPAEG